MEDYKYFMLLRGHKCIWITLFYLGFFNIIGANLAEGFDSFPPLSSNISYSSILVF